MRLRAPFALGGLLILALGGLIGFAAFSTDVPPVPTTVVSGQLPEHAEGRIAAAAFVATIRGDVVTAVAPSPAPPPTTTTSPPTPPQPVTTSTTSTTSERAAAPASATTTRPPAPATTASAPPPPSIAPTTAAPPPTTVAPTTTTPTTTTTTVPPSGDPYEVEDWRPLVEQYFPPERTEEALSVMWCESRGNPTVVNDVSGAAGLFQFVPNTWGWASAEAGWSGASVFDPEANIATAAWLVQVSIETNHPGGPWGHWSCQPE